MNTQAMDNYSNIEVGHFYLASEDDIVWFTYNQLKESYEQIKWNLPMEGVLTLVEVRDSGIKEHKEFVFLYDAQKVVFRAGRNHFIQCFRKVKEEL